MADHSEGEGRRGVRVGVAPRDGRQLTGLRVGEGEVHGVDSAAPTKRYKYLLGSGLGKDCVSLWHCLGGFHLPDGDHLLVCQELSQVVVEGGAGSLRRGAINRK